ncbi:MAG: hypothetical protein K6G50_02860 [bacterium]|nr:hypothetical protein [bacterium]
MAVDNDRMVNAFALAYGCDVDIQPWEQEEALKKRGKNNAVHYHIADRQTDFLK